MTPNPIDYRSPNTRPAEPDLEYSFGCFPAMAGGVFAVGSWSCTILQYGEISNTSPVAGVCGIALGLGGAGIGMLVTRRTSGGWFGWPVVVLSIIPAAVDLWLVVH